MDAKVTAQKILQEVGGENNVKNLTHCVTTVSYTHLYFYWIWMKIQEICT